jgi:UDP-N-acetylmuramate: L-alanyl-gamma-D-glutamyl-meso-diaminopimelate ligase
MRIHFIAIGGAIMHNLAIVLKRKGNIVTGSDDHIADPAKTNLQKEQLLPATIGFFAENITPDIDVVILGMHARVDNPELLKAQELGLKVVSFPEYLYEVAKDKTRIVIAGSHGKTTITSMVMHVLKYCGKEFDYMVGAKVKGFDTSVSITEHAPLIVLEGDEYLASPIHRESKFLFYKPHIALITGIAWDHINVFPVYEGYMEQFRKFAQSVENGGTLTWCAEDDEVKKVCTGLQQDIHNIPYTLPDYYVSNGYAFLKHNGKEYKLSIFGKHNLQNLAGAMQVCKAAGIAEEDFCVAIQSFEGAANRLQPLGKNESVSIYKDFAHSPSKLTATVAAAKELFPERKLVAIMELHTFSSLNREFLEQYTDSMKPADIPVVFIDKEVLNLKKMPELEAEFIRTSFNDTRITVLQDAATLENFLHQHKWKDSTLLLMSSGNFAGLDITGLTSSILQ